MKRILLPALLFATALSGTAQAASIFEAMEMAYENNPTLQAERAYLRSLDENVAIANSGYRPTIALTGSYNDSNSNNSERIENKRNNNGHALECCDGQFHMTSH